MSVEYPLTTIEIDLIMDLLNFMLTFTNEFRAIFEFIVKGKEIPLPILANIEIICIHYGKTIVFARLLSYIETKTGLPSNYADFSKALTGRVVINTLTDQFGDDASNDDEFILLRALDDDFATYLGTKNNLCRIKDVPYKTTTIKSYINGLRRMITFSKVVFGDGVCLFNLADLQLQHFFFSAEQPNKNKLQALNESALWLSALNCIGRNAEPWFIRKYYGNLLRFGTLVDLFKLFSSQMRVATFEARHNDAQEVRQDEILIPWEEYQEKTRNFIDEILENLDTCKINHLQSACLMGLSILANPPRRCEYIKLECRPPPVPEREFRKGDKFDLNANWYDRESGQIILNWFKTAVVFGQYTFFISGKIKKIMDKLIDRRPANKYLFVGNEVDFSNCNKSEVFSRLSAPCIGFEISARNLRVSCVTYNKFNGHVNYIREQSKLAYEMGHSITAQNESYSRRIYFPDDPLIGTEIEVPE